MPHITSALEALTDRPHAAPGSFDAIVPTHISTGAVDQFGKPINRTLTDAERIEMAKGRAAMWQRKAAEMEVSADGWAANGDANRAAINLETAKEYRAMADNLMAELEALGLPVIHQLAAE